MRQPIEMRERTASALIALLEIRGQRLRAAPHFRGETPGRYVPFQHVRDSAQTVSIFKEKGDRFLDIIFNAPWIQRRVTRQRGLEKWNAPSSGSIPPLPDRIAFQPFDRLDSGLATLAPFDHTLKCFQRMKTIRVQFSISERQGILNLGVIRNFQNGVRLVSGIDEPAIRG